MAESAQAKAARLRAEADAAEAEAVAEAQERIDAAIEKAARDLSDNSELTMEQARNAIAERITPPDAGTDGTDGTAINAPPDTPPADTPPGDEPPPDEPPGDGEPSPEAPPEQDPPQPPASGGDPPPADVRPRAAHLSQRRIGLPRRRQNA